MDVLYFAHNQRFETIMNYPHLTSAPITEAIFDIRVKAHPGFQAVDFSELKTDLQRIFPNVEERRGGQFTIRIKPGEPQPADVQDLGLQGFFFKSEDEKLIAQFRVDGFTLNKLKPYSSWDELLPLAADLWNRFTSVAKPLAVTRCALRYINHIVINETQFDFDDYLTVAPQVPQALPQTINGFLSKITIVDDTKMMAAHVTQVFEPHPSIPNTPIIIDIDAFKNVDIGPDDANLWEIFTDLRTFKNRIFFNFLTDKTIGLVK